MQLGIFTKDAKTGIFTGSIKTLNDNIEGITIVPITKRGEAGPDYRVHGANGSDFGAGWNKTARDGGKPYISLTLRDPAFNDGQALYPIIVAGEDGQFVMAWEAPDPDKVTPVRPASAPATAPAAPAAPAPARKS